MFEAHKYGAFWVPEGDTVVMKSSDNLKVAEVEGEQQSYCVQGWAVLDFSKGNDQDADETMAPKKGEASKALQM